MEKVHNALSSEQRSTLMVAWRGWHYTWPQTEKWEQDQSHQLCGTLKGDAKKNQPQWQDLGSPGRHHLSSSGWHSPKSSCSLFPTTEAPPLPRPLAAFLGEPSPMREHTQLPQQGESLSSPWGAPGSGPPARPFGLGAGSVGHNLGQREGAAPDSASLHPFQPSPLQSQGLLCSALELQSSWGQSLGLVFSFWGSRRLQPSGKRSLNAAYLEKAQAGGVSSPPPTQKEDADAQSSVLFASPLLPPSSSLLPPSFPFWEDWIKKHKHFWSACSKWSTVF